MLRGAINQMAINTSVINGGGYEGFLTGVSSTVQEDHVLSAVGSPYVTALLDLIQDNQALLGIGDLQITGLLDATQDDETLLCAPSVLITGVVGQAQDSNVLTAEVFIGMADHLDFPIGAVHEYTNRLSPDNSHAAIFSHTYSTRLSPHATTRSLVRH
jgi:hypothetical protein